MSFGISFSVYPTASLAAIFAIGNPVALEARAELRETRGFISMTICLPLSGSTANCILEPPVSTPISRMILIAEFRISWYSLSLRVWIGATVILSPVCIPIGSKFSIEQIITTLSAISRITSSSNSFQPITDSSINISFTGLIDIPWATISRYSSTLYEMPPPAPPRVNAGLMIAG